MKVLHIIFSFMLGGAETMLADIINEQIERGHDVGLLVINSDICEDVINKVSSKAKIFRFNRKQGSMPLLLMARLNLFVMRYNPEIVHLHTHKLNGLLYVKRKRTLYTVHDLRTPMIYAKKNTMAAISDAVKEDVLSRVPNARIKTICNGIRTDLIAKRNTVNYSEPFKIVQVARLVYNKKGQDILIQAVARLIKLGRNIRLTFIGDGEDREFLKQLVNNEGISENVTFLGNIERTTIYKTLKDYDAMCHPARFEGFGLTIAEAMSAGIPLILPQGGGPWEVAGYGKYCKTFQPENIDDCAAAIQAVMDNYDDAIALAHDSIDFTEKNFSVKHMIDCYDEYYREITNS